MYAKLLIRFETAKTIGVFAVFRPVFLRLLAILSANRGCAECENHTASFSSFILIINMNAREEMRQRPNFKIYLCIL